MVMSGNGQHRRPRRASRIVVTAGVAGAGIAIPLLTSATAHAATVSTWQKVAGCETGARWGSAADGFHGGLALTQDVWLTYGGAAYAGSADLADRDQQIAVAQRLLDARGPGYWTGCAAQAGLASGGPAPDVHPTAPAEPAPLGGLLGAGPSAAPPDAPAGVLGTAAPTPSAAATAPATSAPAGSVAPVPPPSSATPSPGATPPGTGPAGRHAGTPADESGPQETGPAGGARGAHAGPAGRYTVRPGDTLEAIAARHALPGGWRALYDANRGTVGRDPGLIRPGQRLRLR